MRLIKQLSTIYLALPGATHTRFEHSVGVYHLATRAYEVLLEKGLEIRNSRRKAPLGYVPPPLSPFHLLALQIAALLHDIGHGPFSHVFDLFLRTFHVDKADMPTDHEDVARQVIMGEIPGCEDIAEFLETVYKENDKEPFLHPGNIANLIVGDPPMEEAGGAKYIFLAQIISKAWGVDRLDYLRRDAFHTGVETGRLDIWNLINAYTFKPADDGKCWELALEAYAAPWLEAMLDTRDLCYRLVYFSDTNRIAVEMLLRALKFGYEKLTGESKNGSVWKELWIQNDHELIVKLQQLDTRAGNLARRVLARRLYEPLPVAINLAEDLDDEARRWHKALDKPTQAKGRTITIPEAFRELVLRTEEELASQIPDLPPNETIILDVHVPPLEPEKTFTEKILYDEATDTFVSLIEAAPHLKLLKEKFKIQPFGFEGSIDELYRARMMNLKVYWPYELVERIVETAEEQYGGKIEDLSKAIEVKLEEVSTKIMDTFLEILHVKKKKKEEILSRLRESIKILVHEIIES